MIPIVAQSSSGGRCSSSCSNSIECLWGESMNAMWRSHGGRLTFTPTVHQLSAGLVYVVDPAGKMAEIPAAGQFLRIPVPPEFDHGRNNRDTF
ncbi:MAG: hypothetical protein ACNA7E_09370 [Wenzhouxiangellaceae bacterium]